LEVLRFGLGVRFDVLEGEEQATPRQLWEEVFSVLTTSEVKGLHVFGGRASLADYASSEPCYICAFTNGSLKQLRRVYQKLNEDAGVGMYLTATHPFIQSNALEKIEGLTFYGRIQRDGTLFGGEEPFFDVRVCKKRGKRKPMGKGIVFLLSPGTYRGLLSSKQAIRRLTLAARRHFPGVRILPLPIVNGGPGTVDALLTACNGIARTVRIKSPGGSELDARYAVLRGSVAVIEMPAVFCAQVAKEVNCSSFGIGELIRRALDEGIKEIVIGLSESGINDGGLGCLRALGAKLLDSEGNELSGACSEISDLCSIDTEFLHPRIKNTSFTIMTDCLQKLFGEDGIASARFKDNSKEMEAMFLKLGKIFAKATGLDVGLQRGAGAAGGLGAALMSFLKATQKSSISALFEAAELERRVKNVSLVVTGEGVLDSRSLEPDRAVGAIVELCAKQRIPIAVIVGSMGAGSEELLDKCECSMIAAIDQATVGMALESSVALFDSAADRMFRFIRLGREIERVSARKSKK